MIKAGVIGATGYAGAELVRLLTMHPAAEVAAISSVSFEGKMISEVYPSFFGFCDHICRTAEEVIDRSEVVFAALPHGMSQEFAYQCISQGKKFIDLGADFRLDNEDDYEQWYDGQYIYPELHEEAVYGLPELLRSEIRGKRIVSNPGCYPTSAALALAPALKVRAIKTKGIVIDSKSGVTGAGRGLTQTGHFPEANENFSAYKVACHRHTPEIEQTLTRAAGASVRITFVPHLLPVNRGILSTCYAKLSSGLGESYIREVYETAYRNEYFVRLLPAGQTACIKNVKCSNFCDISLHVDTRTETLIVIAAIDNMVKGAAGQAIQNMNIMFGYPETTGLEFVPPAF